MGEPTRPQKVFKLKTPERRVTPSASRDCDERKPDACETGGRWLWNKTHVESQDLARSWIYSEQR